MREKLWLPVNLRLVRKDWRVPSARDGGLHARIMLRRTVDASDQSPRNW